MVGAESRDHDAHAVVPHRSCVEAYKKMNNVLIDDSRIRVDFSQSVAKIWSRYTMQYKGSAAAKLREKHRKGGSKLDAGHYGPGGPSQRAYGGRSGEDVYAADHVRDYRGRLDDRDRRRGDRRDPGRSLGIEGLDDRRDATDRSRRDRSRERTATQGPRAAQAVAVAGAEPAAALSLRPILNETWGACQKDQAATHRRRYATPRPPSLAESAAPKSPPVIFSKYVYICSSDLPLVSGRKTNRNTAPVRHTEPYHA